MRWLGRHWVAVVGILVSGLYIYLQLLQWKKHGDDFMLTAANVIVTASLWAILLVAIGRYWKSGSQPRVDRPSKDETDWKKLYDEANKDRSEAANRVLELERAIEPTLKDSDPRIEIEFRDERHRQGEDAYLTPVNRGQTPAKFVCLEPIPLREHTVSFPTFGYYLAPVRHENMRPVVSRNDGGIDKNADFLAALYSEYEHLKDPPFELIEPVIATYQDQVGNLFQTRCELVFNPSDYVDFTNFGKRHLKVIEIRNHTFKRKAAAIF